MLRYIRLFPNALAEFARGNADERANVLAVCRRNEAELNKVADPDIDFVHINSPIPDHAWMSLKALDAGKHMIGTVPMATTIDECQQVVEKVEETRLKYMMAETVVYSREFLFIKELYDKGGEIVRLPEFTLQKYCRSLEESIDAHRL